MNHFKIKAADISTWHAKEDYKLDGADDENPYLFPYLKKLGKQEGKVLDVKKNKALRNAGGFHVSCFVCCDCLTNLVSSFRESYHVLCG